MNDLVLKVTVVPVQDSFVHLSSKLVRELNRHANRQHPVCLKVTAIDGGGSREKLYASYSQTPYNSNGDDALNVSYELASTAGLAASEYVLVTVFDEICPLEQIHVSPVSDDDWDLLTLNNVALQDNILQQLQIVHKDQKLPIWVSKFIHLKLTIDYLGNNVQVGLLRNSTEIVVKLNPANSINSTSNKNTSTADQNVDDNVPTDEIINQNDHSSISMYCNRFVFRTILVDQTLFETEYIYDYCALISKTHMSLLNKNTDHTFVKVSLLHKLNNIKDSKNNSKVDDKSVIVNLCPLDKYMYNIEKIENISWPTIYVTKTVFLMLNLSMNSKVVLEVMNQNENNICDAQNINVFPIKVSNNISQQILTECTIKRLKEEILLRNVLVLNNVSVLRVLYNKLLPQYVLVKFSLPNIPCIFLNEYNFKLLKFMSQGGLEKVKSYGIFNETLELGQFTDTSILEYYDLKCFEEFIKNGSLCLKVGLQCYSYLSQSFMEFDNLLITGPIGSGKTSAAKFFCNKFSKCPYFVKIIWINGRFLAGKLWETVQKQIQNHFEECLYYQPAIIVIDDFDDLCHLNFEPNDRDDIMSKIYLRPLNIMMNLIQNYTSMQHHIRVICTAKPLTQSNETLFLKLSKDIFKTVITIPVIDKENKKLIISKRLNKIQFDHDVDDKFLIDLCQQMDSYVMQDLIDYCDKVLFEIFKDGCNKKLTKTVFNNVYEKNVPLSLGNSQLFKEKKLNFSFVGGLKEAKQMLIESIIWPSLHSDVFSQCPLKLQSGVLLYGPPGTGKTLLAKALVGESNLNFISVNGPELLSKYVGQSEESVRNLFQRAQNAKPCIIFFDEFESIVPRRGSDQIGVTDRVVNQFLTQLDGVDTYDGVWVIAATSRPDLIDQALLRPGRIGVKLHCSIPTIDDREDILKVLCDQVTLSNDVNLRDIAIETNNYSGADLNGLIYSAYTSAEKKLVKDQSDTSFASNHNDCKPIITADDFQVAIKTTKPSLSQAEIDRYEQIHRVFSGRIIQDNDGASGTQESNQKRLQKTIFKMISYNS